MRIIRTTLLLSLPCGACVLNQPEATTDVALETGSETTQVSSADASSSSDTGSSGSSGSSSTGEPSSSGDGSSSGAPDLCGNGVIDGDEKCDGDAGDKICTDLGPNYNGGQLACTADCNYDTSGCERCEAPGIKPCDLVDPTDPFMAMELDCDLLKDQGWDANNAVSLSKRVLMSDDPTAFRVFSSYGNSDAWNPRAGARALIISTGSFPPVKPDGALTADPGTMNPGMDNMNPTYKGGLPPEYRITPNKGGTTAFEDCDGTGDCSNTLMSQWEPTQALVDAFYLEFETIVPAGTHGYELDLAFFTAHYPVYKAEPGYNDVFLIWSQSEAYVGNITYLHDAKTNSVQPMSLTALVNAGLIAHDGGALDLEMLGTGFHGKDTPGGATPWLTVAGPAQPGEAITLAIAGFDAHDYLYDSAMILDNFRWSCGGCELGVDCGLRLQQ